MKLVIEHVRKGYDGREIIRDGSFAFPEHSVSVLMGPNGCGKSTLLRICALLERPDSGELRFLDNDRLLAQDIGLRRRITLVLPRTGVFNTSVFHNAAYGLEVRGTARAEQQRRVEKALSFVRLERMAQRQARTLSSGETQRMGIARALAVEPEILLLDEPTASVDEENTALIESIICELRQGGRTTIIMTTHDRDQAQRLADRMLIITRGVLTER